MSVINQMLRDLDERQGRAQLGSHQGAAIVTKKNNAWVWPVALVVLIVVLAWLFRAPLSSWLTKEEVMTTSAQVTDTTPEPIMVVEKSPQDSAIVESRDKQALTNIDKAPAQVIPEQSLASVPQQLESLVTMPDTTDVISKNESASEASRVKKTSPARDKRMEAEALYDQLTEANGPALSVSQMEQVLGIDPDYHKVRILWLSRLSQANQSQFEIEIQRAINSFPEIFQYRQMLARTLVVEQPRQAYELLTANLPTIRQAPDYHGLIAYSAKQMGDYNLASKQYQLLLKEYPERADWWLALGVTEEQLGKASSALAAYQQSLRFPGLAANTRAWAQQRITTLQGF